MLGKEFVVVDGLWGKIEAGTREVLAKALAGEEISVEEGAGLFQVQGPELMALIMVADQLRQQSVGDPVTFVHNRNINFTNVCIGGCLFCGFHRRMGDDDAFLLSLEEIVRKAVEAYQLGATEVCIQGGLNPSVDPHYYFHICAAIKEEVPQIHIHAFSPMEVYYGARRLGWSVRDFFIRLKEAGLDSMPGTAAEILHDSIRKVICPGKLTVKEWVEVMKTAHHLGIPSSATMMYGHLEKPWHLAAHLQIIREIQKETQGFTEFVPLSFIHPNTELFRRGYCGPGASGLMDLKVFAVSRIMLNGFIDNIQVSWVKLGRKLAQICLWAGGNDLGGTLMEEHISRMAGASTPSQMSIDDLRSLIEQSGRRPVQRTTTYDLLL
ncbi:MAG: 5-amino-6-(D-ribitylamino)uracil--L-tyrosine 4-hydroxyphenyl transferase CofH [Clostridia bacterium]|nr:5-amino-6-(D-ribitylamino)uracil--L-tyrosine 4-hydroxyphenyl transferase CofH [Clostridia bacterium]